MVVSSNKLVVAISVLLAICGSVVFASTAHASPPKYASIKAGPGFAYPKTGYFENSDSSIPAQCWVEGSDSNIWLQITSRGVTGFAPDTPYNSIQRIDSTPACPPPSAACSSNGFQNTIVQWYNGPNQQNTAWYADSYCNRRWIKNITIYWCLRDQGVVDKGAQPPVILDSLPDQWGIHITCLRELPPG